MFRIAVCVVSILLYTSVVPIVAETPDLAAARSAGENDAKGFQWKWFAASYMTTNTSVIAIWLVYSLNETFFFNTLDTIPPACGLTLYGVYILTPTAAALIDSPTPPADRLLGKSPQWVSAYTKAYQKSMRRHRAQSSGAGCLLGGMALFGTIYALAPGIWGSTPGDVD